MVDVERMIGEVARRTDRYAGEVVRGEAGLEYPLSSAQRVAAHLGLSQAITVAEIEQPWDPDRFARVWRGILDDHPILRSTIDHTAGMICERHQGEWGSAGIVHLDLSGLDQWAARRAIDQLKAAILAGDAHAETPVLAHRLVTVARPGGGFSVLVATDRLVFDARSQAVLERRLVNGYALGGPGVPARRPYSDYVRFAAMGPRDISDEAVVRELDLERFAQVAATYAASRPAAPPPPVDLECDLEPGASADDVDRLVADALSQVTPTMPVFAAVAGRRYTGGDFSDYLGLFADLVPLVVDSPDPTAGAAPQAGTPAPPAPASRAQAANPTPASPAQAAHPPAPAGLGHEVRRRAAFLARYNLTVTSLLADPLIAGRFPIAAGFIAQAAAAMVPVLNVPGMLGGFAGRPVAVGSVGPVREILPVIDVQIARGALTVRALPAQTPAQTPTPTPTPAPTPYR
ncbi:MAG: hypothetical protein LBH48_04165 [Bifidobacteriaceae bacterium]|nr:hypothetical protein [Bifidobacteriaceae bacterium]